MSPDKLPKPSILFQDQALFVIDKPPGWIVNEAVSTKGKPVIQTWLKNNFDYPLKSNRELRNGMVHRLDKETSGVMLFAKTPDSLKDLQAQFKKRETQKTYKALLHGRVEPKEQTINLPTGRLPWNRERFGVLPGGKKAVTGLKVLDYYQKEQEEYSYVEFFPKTGRTHQLRVHSKHIHHPIVADSFYAGRKRARADKLWCPRTFLHAYKIKLTHPKTKQVVEYKSPLPQDLKDALTTCLKKDA